MRKWGFGPLVAVGAAAMALSLYGNSASAMVAGGGPEYPIGASLGLPAGAAPPEGVYVNLHPNGSQTNTVDNRGNRTGAGATVFGDFGVFTYVPGIKILGADYSMAVRGPGILSVEVHAPPFNSAANHIYKNGVRATGTGIVDITVAPITLSWALGNGWFFSGELAVDVPSGPWDANNLVNTGKAVWTFTPSIALTYLKNGYDLTAHLITETPTQNTSQQYTTGSLGLLDLTATKKFGRWTTGPLGMYWGQWSPDSGPAALRTPYPVEIAAGWDLGYDLAPGIALNGWLLRDIYARSVGSLAVRWQVNLLFKAF